MAADQPTSPTGELDLSAPLDLTSPDAIQPAYLPPPDGLPPPGVSTSDVPPGCESAEAAMEECASCIVDCYSDVQTQVDSLVRDCLADCDEACRCVQGSYDLALAELADAVNKAEASLIKQTNTLLQQQAGLLADAESALPTAPTGGTTAEITSTICPEGEHYDPALNACLPGSPVQVPGGPPPVDGPPPTCQPGYHPEILNEPVPGWYCVPNPDSTGGGPGPCSDYPLYDANSSYGETIVIQLATDIYWQTPVIEGTHTGSEQWVPNYGGIQERMKAAGYGFTGQQARDTCGGQWFAMRIGGVPEPEPPATGEPNGVCVEPTPVVCAEPPDQPPAEESDSMRFWQDMFLAG